MFAIALWDRETRSLMLARDRLGEKPLYYGWQGKGHHAVFLFGSELKALRRHPAFAGEIARDSGLHHVYTGNVHDKQGESTYCHACNTRLIGRDWYVLSDWNLDEQGRCNNCGTPCAGVFEVQAGTWGSRRQPVRLRDFAA